jgi:predicted ArsR family transcriptional regulator
MGSSRREQIAAVAAVDDPQRAALYDYVSRQSEPVGRDDAAEHLGISRSTVAFHLDRLVEQGLLVTEYRRLSGRTGPGSGRPAKLYRRAPGDVQVSIPPRQYELASELLASAIDEAERSHLPVREALASVATATGRRLGAQAGSLDAALEEGGYQPRADEAGRIALANCPFHRLASAHTELVCHANAALLRGIAEGAGADPETVEAVTPLDDGCCVRITRMQDAIR